MRRGFGQGAGALVLAYHDVGHPGPTFTRYSVSPARLRWQLEAATAWGLRFVPLPELVETVAGGRDAAGRAAVAFDDCLIGVHRHAAPILADLGVPATLFAVPGALGRTPGWWPGSVPTMTAAELRELVDAGFGAGAHGMTHRSLTELGPQALEAEVRGSRQALEDLLGRPVAHFAYPFGHHDGRVRHAVLEAGYRAAFTFVNGRITADLDLLRLPRLTMHDGVRRLRFARWLARPPGGWPDTQHEVVAGTR
jgi:peptidoglycan/xylan/chitin deacetylase (PgdA/CDA1 family)